MRDHKNFGGALIEICDLKERIAELETELTHARERIKELAGDRKSMWEQRDQAHEAIQKIFGFKASTSYYSERHAELLLKIFGIAEAALPDTPKCETCVGLGIVIDPELKDIEGVPCPDCTEESHND